MELPDAPTEDGTERDGFLSYAGEVHALTLGLGAGLAAGMTGRAEPVAVVAAVALGLQKASSGEMRELEREPWYGLGGLLFGLAVGLGLQATGYV